MSETTPLRGLNTNEGARFVTYMFQKENLEKAGAVASVAKARLDELTRSAREGDISIRLLALLGGVALIAYSVLGFMQHILLFEIVKALIEIYAFALGLIIVILESRQLHLPESFLKSLYKYALFLKFVWGRGLLYFVAGSLQLSQGGIIDFVVGGFVMFVGALYIYVGQQTAIKLREMRKTLYSEQSLRTKFEESDREGKGKLTKEQFQDLIDRLGMHLNRRETEAAFLHISKDAGALSFDDFGEWWANCDEEHLDLLV